MLLQQLEWYLVVASAAAVSIGHGCCHGEGAGCSFSHCCRKIAVGSGLSWNESGRGPFTVDTSRDHSGKDTLHQFSITHAKL